MLAPQTWVCSSAWLERTPDKGEVGGSNPPRPTNFWVISFNWGYSSAGRAPGLHPGGQQFDPA